LKEKQLREDKPRNWCNVFGRNKGTIAFRKADNQKKKRKKKKTHDGEKTLKKRDDEKMGACKTDKMILECPESAGKGVSNRNFGRGIRRTRSWSVGGVLKGKADEKLMRRLSRGCPVLLGITLEQLREAVEALTNFRGTYRTRR